MAAPDLSHLSDVPPSLGPSADFFEVFKAAQRRQIIVDSAYGMPLNVHKAYSESVARAARLTNQNLDPGWGFPTYSPDAIQAGINRSLGEQPESGLAVQGQSGKYLADIDRLDAAITAAKAQDPTLKTFQEAVDDEIKQRLRIIDELESARLRGGPGAWLPELLGAIKGSFNFETDPLLVASIFVPLGVSKNLAYRLLREAAVAASAQAAQDILFVQPRAAKLGEQAADPFTSIMTAALGAAALRGAGEALVPVARRLSPTLDAAMRQRELAGVVSEGLAGRFPYEPQFRNGEMIEGFPSVFGRSSEELLAAVRQLPDSVDRAVAEAGLETDIAVADHSPHLDTPEGRMLTEIDLAQAGAQFELPPATVSRIFPEGPSPEQVARDVAEQEVGLLERRVADTEAKVTEAQTRLDLALAAQAKFKAGVREGNIPTFDEQIKQVKARFDEQIGELETIAREEGRLDDPLVALERARIQKQAFEAMREIGTVRFVTERMLREEVAKARRVISDAKRNAPRMQERLKAAKAQAEAPPKGGKLTPKNAVEQTKAALRVTPRPADPATIARITDEFVPIEKVDELVKIAKESLKDSVEPGFRMVPVRPPVLTAAEADRLPMVASSTEHKWRLANELGIVDRIVALAQEGQTPHDIAIAITKDFDKNVRLSAKEAVVKAVLRKLEVPEDYVTRVAKGTPKAPVITVLGRDIAADQMVPGPSGTRKAIDVLEEIDDEDALLRAITECGLP